MLRNIIKYGGRCRAYDVAPQPVQSGLSISPAEMNECVKANIPISASMVSDDLLSKGHKGSDPSVPILRQRGMDFSDVYCAESAARDKIASAASSAPVIDSNIE